MDAESIGIEYEFYIDHKWYMDGRLKNPKGVSVGLIQRIIEENVQYLKEEGDIPENHRATMAISKSLNRDSDLISLGGFQWLPVPYGTQNIEIEVTTSQVGGRKKTRKRKI